MTEQVITDQRLKRREATRELLLTSSFGEYIRDTWTNGPVLSDVAKELEDMDLEDAIVDDLEVRQNLTEHDIYISVVCALNRQASRLKKIEKISKTIRKGLINTHQAVGWARERNRMFNQQ